MFESIALLSWQRGTHALKFGVDLRQYLSAKPLLHRARVRLADLIFDNTLTDNPAAPAVTGGAMASMLLGYPSTTVRDFFLPGTAHVFTKQLNFFLADDWRATRKLTLNIGVHYEVDTPPHERNNYLGQFQSGHRSNTSGRAEWCIFDSRGSDR